MEIITDHRDKARKQDKYVVTFTPAGVEFRPFKCSEDKAVFVDWGSVLNQARRAQGRK